MSGACTNTSLQALDTARLLPALDTAYSACLQSTDCAPCYFLNGGAPASLQTFQVIAANALPAPDYDALVQNVFYEAPPVLDVCAALPANATLDAATTQALAENAWAARLGAAGCRLRQCSVNEVYKYNPATNEGVCACRPGRDCSQIETVGTLGLIVAVGGVLLLLGAVLIMLYGYTREDTMYHAVMGRAGAK